MEKERHKYPRERPQSVYVTPPVTAKDNHSMFDVNVSNTVGSVFSKKVQLQLTGMQGARFARPGYLLLVLGCWRDGRRSRIRAPGCLLLVLGYWRDGAVPSVFLNSSRGRASPAARLRGRFARPVIFLCCPVRVSEILPRARYGYWLLRTKHGRHGGRRSSGRPRRCAARRAGAAPPKI